MNQVNEYFRQAELSLAAYAFLIPEEPISSALTEAGMTNIQATDFAAKWIVVEQYNHSETEEVPVYDDGGNITSYITRTTSNGLSVTVFEDIATGERHVAIRGTEITDLGDLTADGGILLHGIPNLSDQYQSLKSRIEEWQASGVLADPFTVTGHSLGGWLASGLAIQFADSIEHTYLYNSPGILGTEFDTPLQQLKDALGLSEETTFKLDNVSNIRASAGNFLISGLGYALSDPIDIFTEDQTFSDVLNPPLARNHSQQVLMDSLAVYALFGEISSALTLDTIESILQASGNRNAMTLENAVNALGDLFQAGSPISSVPKRDELYPRIQAIRGSAAYQAAIQAQDFISIQSLTGSSDGEIAAKAMQASPEGLAYRYALSHLNPFLILGDESIFGNHNAYGELDLYDPASGTGELSEHYLRDRAAMLSWKMKFDTGAMDDDDYFFQSELLPARMDKPYAEEWDSWSVNGDWNYVDLAVGNYGSTLSLFVDGRGDSIFRSDPDRQIIFGSSASERLEGQEAADRLYGGGGDDTLFGNRGNDHLEGGQGFDTYRFSAGDGSDTVLDSDGLGVINIGGVEALGSAGLDPTQWKQLSADSWADIENGITYRRSVSNGESRLLVHKGDVNIIVRGWSEGELGITLGAPSLPAIEPLVTDLVLVGDLRPVDFDSSQAGIQSKIDALGNIIVSDVAEPGREDVLYDSLGNDLIQGLGGNDRIIAWRGGDDRIVGGAGSDILDGGDGNDHIHADVERGFDEAYRLGEIQLASGMRGDLLSGGAGGDFLVGDTGDDILAGGMGNDILVGMGGDDIIEGDASVLWAGTDWKVERTVTSQDNTTLYNREYNFGMSSADFSAEGGDDTLFAGAGNDWVLAGGGDDFVDAGPGDDVVFGGAGNDVILGQDGNDVLAGDSMHPNLDASLHGDDYLSGGAGDDRMWGGGGSDYLDGGDGNDVLVGDGEDVPEPFQGDDYLEGGEGDDELYGNGGNDTLSGGPGSDRLYGGMGDDTYLDVGPGDVIADIQGHSTIILAAANGVADGLSPTVATTPDSTLGIALDDGSTLDLQGALYGMNATLQFANGDVLDLESWVSENLLHPVFLNLDSVALPSGGRVEYAYGGAGDDQILGGDGNDILKGYGGNDFIQGGDGNDVLEGGTGDDALLGEAGNDTLLGGAGDDELQGNAGDDRLDGGSGNDTLFGQEGKDILDGGGGDDVLVGNSEADTYLFDLGGGRDVIWEEGDSAGDVLRFGSGIAPTDITVSKTGYDLVLSHANGTDQVTVANWYGGTSWQLSRFEFYDGTIWTGAAADSLGLLTLRGTAGDDAIYGSVADETLLGLEGNDQLWGNGGADLLQGGKGNDWLVGGAGADVYRFGLGDGEDVIDGDNSDALHFGGDISKDEIAVERVGADLLLRHENGSDSVRVANWYANTYYRLQKVVFESDGTVLLASQLSLMGTNIDHQYLLDPGDGAKVVEDWGGVDTLTFGMGISESELHISRSGQDLRFAHVNGTDSLVIRDWFNDVSKQIETIRFANGGTALTHAQLTVPFLTLMGTDAAETIQGGNAYEETLSGLGGNDVLYGGGGNDHLYGGAGDDQLYGGEGADTYYFNQGDGQDTISDTSSGNTLVFGPGLLGLLTVSGGFGQDVVYSFGTTADSVRVKAGSQLAITFVSEGSAAADVLNGSSHGDIIYGLGGDDVINGNEGADTLHGGAGNDTLVGGAGSDRLYGGDGDDILDGYQLTGASDDQTYGSDSRDYYFGGKGNDTLYGNSGGDSYFFDIGDGHDQIVEGSFFWNGQWFYSSDDELVFGPGVSLESLAASKVGSDLLLRVSETDSVTIRNWFADSKSWVETFRFDDGRVAGASDMTRLALTQHGTPGDDVLTGDASWGDALYGLAGDDVLEGQGGNDFLHGGQGNDLLYGGSGNDEYLFERGDGHDTIGESSGDDTVRFGGSISASDISIDRDGDHLLLRVAGSDDTLTINHYFTESFSFSFANATYSRWHPDYRVESFVFEDGSRLPTAAEIVSSYSIMGSGDADDLSGTAFTDVIHGTGGDDVLHGLEGDDTLYGNDGADFLFGGSGDDNLVGGNGNDTLAGGAGSDILLGEAGDDVLSGGAGSDILVGGLGADSYLYYQGDGHEEIYDYGSTSADQADRIVFGPGINLSDLIFSRWGNDLDLTLPGGGITINRHFESPNYSVERLEFADGSVIGLTDVQFGGGVMNGSVEDSILLGSYGNDTLNGGAGNDWLDGSAGSDRMVGGPGDDHYLVDYRRDIVTEEADEGIDTVYSTISYSLTSNVEILVLAGSSATKAVDNTLDNLLIGNGAANTLTGGIGNDILIAGAGADTLKDTAGCNLLSGGEDADTLTGGAGSEIFIGGTGDDILTTGSGADVIVFNRGDGSDLVNGSVGSDNTLSLGGGIAYAELSLSKVSSDLILDLGQGDQITFKNWYAKKADYRSVATLQMIQVASADFDPDSADPLLDHKLERFDFVGMVEQFDMARSTDSSLTAWSLTHALAEFHLGGSDTEALGGDLAYYYGRDGSLEGMSLKQAQDVLGAAAFGASPQLIRPLSGIAGGSVSLPL
jgi:Ca2+-binding RTX toxin-like protein